MVHTDMQVRLAGTRDRRALPDIDPNVKADLGRREAIDAAIAARQCWIADYGGKPAGYGLLSHNFFSRDFVDLIYVAEFARRSGVGNAILAAIEHSCGAESIFTSTNQSNAPMRGLLGKRGYRPSGQIENLDPGDAELVFVKFLPKEEKAHTNWG